MICWRRAHSIPWLRAVGSAALFVAIAASTALADRGDERTRAESTLRELDASPNRALAREAIDRARAALARGDRLRQEGDAAHARLADGAALAWAQMGRDLVRAVEVEARAAAYRRDTADAGRDAEQQRALLEEEIAKNGRLRAQLKALEDGAAEPAARTSAAARRAPAPKPPGAPGRAPAPGAAAARDGGAP